MTLSYISDTTIKRPLPECFLPYGSENGDYALQRRDDDSTYEFIGVNVVLSGDHERLIYVSAKDNHDYSNVDRLSVTNHYVGEYEWSDFTQQELHKSKW